MLSCDVLDAMKVPYLSSLIVSRHDINEECMLLADMQHSHPHITLYQEAIFLSCGVYVHTKHCYLMIGQPQ